MSQNDLPPLPENQPNPSMGGAPGEAPTPPPPAPMGGTPIMGYDAGNPIEMNKDARLWGMLAHLSALVGLLGIPPIVGPLVVWLIKKNEFAFVDDQGKEALNFQITMFIALLIGFATVCIGIGFVIVGVVGIVDLIFAIIGAVKANNGERYRYPFAIRLIN